MADLRRGVRLALDWGKARIGVAACDPEGLLAYPVETVKAGPEAVKRLAELVDAYVPIEVIIGLPRDLRGKEGVAAQQLRELATAFAWVVSPLPVRLVDERLTTVVASRQLGSAGRSTRRQRAVIDQAAAVAILEQALNMERTTGSPAGELL